MKKEEREATAEMDWWNEIAALFDTRVMGWTYRNTATFVNGICINDSRIAKKLYQFIEESK